LNQYKSEVSLSIVDAFGKRTTVAISVDRELWEELNQRVEISNDPMSQYLSNSTFTVKEHVFKLRQHHAKDLSDRLVEAMVRLFGDNDVRDGYRVGAEAKKALDEMVEISQKHEGEGYHVGKNQNRVSLTPQSTLIKTCKYLSVHPLRSRENQSAIVSGRYYCKHYALSILSRFSF